MRTEHPTQNNDFIAQKLLSILCDIVDKINLCHFKPRHYILVSNIFFSKDYLIF
jgi:hypothetical protein